MCGLRKEEDTMQQSYTLRELSQKVGNVTCPFFMLALASEALDVVAQSLNQYVGEPLIYADEQM